MYYRKNKRMQIISLCHLEAVHYPVASQSF